MYNILFVVTLMAEKENAGAGALAAKLAGHAKALPNIRNILAQPTLPDVYNGGHVLFRLAFDNADTCAQARKTPAWDSISTLLTDPAAVSQLEEVEYEGGQSGGTSRGSGLYRVALFNANVRPTTERLAAFAQHTLAMPRHIKSILRWQLSNTVKAKGLRSWTHVWEQEYQNLEGLIGPYMLHPVHWGHVERWFDTEYPDYLVDPMLVHSFCNIDGPVIVS